MLIGLFSHCLTRVQSRPLTGLILLEHFMGLMPQSLAVLLQPVEAVLFPGTGANFDQYPTNQEELEVRVSLQTFKSRREIHKKPIRNKQNGPNVLNYAISHQSRLSINTRIFYVVLNLWFLIKSFKFFGVIQVNYIIRLSHSIRIAVEIKSWLHLPHCRRGSETSAPWLTHTLTNCSIRQRRFKENSCLLRMGFFSRYNLGAVPYVGAHGWDRFYIKWRVRERIKSYLSSVVTIKTLLPVDGLCDCGWNQKDFRHFITVSSSQWLAFFFFFFCHITLPHFGRSGHRCVVS